VNAAPPVFVNGNLLDEVAALDAHLLLREQVLDDHVGHVLSESVPKQKGPRLGFQQKETTLMPQAGI
jgi:hypothetical protein